MAKRVLEIELLGDNKSSKAFRGAIRDSETLGSKLSHIGAVGAKALGGAIVAGAAAATYGIYKATQAAEESNKVQAQSEAVLKSTGSQAWISAGQVETLAGAISRKAGVDDEAIQSGENLLLTFKNIRNEAGQGNDIFNQSTQTIVDMSVALDQDLKSSAIQVGKALNDPVKGITALQKVGVSFSDQQKEQIEQWVEEGDVLRAQKAILAELGSEFGGSAAAQATAMDKIKVSVGNVQESVGNIFLPLVEEAAGTLDREFIPQLQETADGLAAIANRKDLDLGEKLALGEDVIKREWGGVPGEVGELMDAAIPVVAEHAGQMGAMWSKAMVTGFLQADPLGKAALVLFASKAFGGPGALIGAGKSAGSKFGGGMATEGSLALASMFGMGSGGAKAFGLIEKAKKVGGVIGKVGLGLGLVEGATAVLESPAEGLIDRLEQVDSRGSGLIGSIERMTGLSDAASAVGIENWAEQGDAAHRLAQILGDINSTHGRQHRLLLAEARALEDQLDLTREQRREAEKTLRVQTIADQSLKQGLSGLRGGQFTRLPDIQAVVRRNQQAISESSRDPGGEAYRNAVAKNYSAAARAIEVGIDRGVIKTKTGMEQIRRYTREAHLVSGDDPWGIAKGFSRSWEKAGGVTRQSLTGIQRDLGKMAPESARMTGQMLIQMAQQMRRKGQLTKAEAERIRSTVVTKVALMAKQGGKQSEIFGDNMGLGFLNLTGTAKAALENLEQNVREALKGLKAGELPSFNLQTLSNASAYHHAREETSGLGGLARGGSVARVPGRGRRDTVPLAINGALSAVVAPGEDLIVANRHQRPALDYAVANTFGDNGLEGFFSRNRRPHFMAEGGLLPKPKLTGPAPLGAIGRGAIEEVYPAARKYVRKYARVVSGGNIVEVGRSLQRLGYEVGEHPAFGGVQPVHVSGSDHYSGHAIDVNDDAPPFGHGSGEMASLDWLAPQLQKLPHRQVIWRNRDLDTGGAVPHHMDHLHFAMAGGGFLPVATFGSGGIVNQISEILARQGLDKEAIAGIIGNAYGESGLNPASEDGHGNGGLWGFTTSPVSLSDLQAYAASQNLPWTSVKAQTQFLAHNLGIHDPNFIEKLNALDSAGATTKLFMEEWERPETMDSLGKRTGYAEKALKMIGAGGDSGGGPASKQQKGTLSGLRHRASALLREIKKLQDEYKKYGGTKQGKRALARALKFAKQAAKKVKAGSHDQAQDLIDKARDSIGTGRDAFTLAGENVYTPGLAKSGIPQLATGTYDPAQEFSPENLPGFDSLPPSVQAQLQSPGLTTTGKYGVLETALSEAGLTDTRTDDAAALNALLGISRDRRRRLKGRLDELNKRLQKGGLTKKQRDTLVKQRDSVLTALGEVSGNVGSIREQIGGLNEEVDDALKEAIEANTQAIEDHTQAQEELAKQVKAQVDFATSATATGSATAWTALADILAGRLGGSAQQQAALAGTGTIGTVNRT